MDSLLYNLYKSNQWNLSHIQNTCNCVFALGYSDTGSLYLGITITVSRKLILCESNKKSNSEILQYGHVAHGERRARAYNEGLGAQPLVGRSGGKAPPPLKLKAFFLLRAYAFNNAGIVHRFSVCGCKIVREFYPVFE